MERGLRTSMEHIEAVNSSRSTQLINEQIYLGSQHCHAPLATLNVRLLMRYVGEISYVLT